LKNKNKKLEIENYLLKKSRRLNEKLLWPTTRITNSFI
jgi:hypothetical protein